MTDPRGALLVLGRLSWQRTGASATTPSIDRPGQSAVIEFVDQRVAELRLRVDLRATLSLRPRFVVDGRLEELDTGRVLLEWQASSSRRYAAKTAARRKLNLFKKDYLSDPTRTST